MIGLLLPLLLMGAGAAPGPPPCEPGAPPALQYQLARAVRAAGCPDVDTRVHDGRLEVHLGEAFALAWPAPCGATGPDGQPGAPVGQWVVHVPAAIAAACPGTRRAFERTLLSVPAPRPRDRSTEHFAPAQTRPPPEEAPPAAAGATLEGLYANTLLPALWLLLLALAIAIGIGRLRKPERRTLLLVAVTTLGLALRLAFSREGPGDLFDNLEAAYRVAVDPHSPGLGAMTLYGPAGESLLLLLFHALPVSHETVFTLDLIASTATIPAIYTFSRRLRSSPDEALVAALLLAVAPLALRFAATDNRYAMLVLLLLVGWTLLLAFLEEGRLLDLLAATIALSLASQLRPEVVYLPVATAGLVLAWSLSRDKPSQKRPTTYLPLLVALAIHAALLALPYAATFAELAGNDDWAGRLTTASRPLFSPNHNAFLSPAYTPFVWPFLALVGLLARADRQRWLTLWLIGAALVAVAVVAPNRVTGDVWSARYHLVSLPLWLILAGRGLALLKSRRAVAAGAMLSAALAAWPAYDLLQETTVEAEHAFLRSALAAVPDDCNIVTYDPQGEDLGLRPSVSLSITAGRWNHRWIPKPEPDVTCQLYYLNASCACLGVRDPRHQATACSESLHKDRVPLARAQLPNRSAAGDRYPAGPIPVGLYWLQRPAPRSTPPPGLFKNN